MVNIDDFIKRLEIILDYYNLSASAFADKISVQRSSLSHLLSGRNKPSLDFIIKVIEVFPEVDLYWILNGKGTFPKSENTSNHFEEVKSASIETPFIQTELESPDLFSATTSCLFTTLSVILISEIIIFFIDVVFSSFPLFINFIISLTSSIHDKKA